MKIQQLIEEQIKQLDSRIQSIIFYTQDINKDEIIYNELYKSHFELVRESTRSFARKLIEALGSEIVGEDVSCARTTHLSDSSCCDYLGERNALKAEQRLKLKELLSNIK